MCKVDTLRWRWLLTLSLRLESILDPGLCGDNHPLITVIYLLVGQDNSGSAGDVDLQEKKKDTKGGRRAGRKVRWQFKINDVNEITDLGVYRVFSSIFFFFFFLRSVTWRHLSAPWWSGVIGFHNQGWRDGQTKSRSRREETVKNRVGGAFRGIFSSEQKNSSSKETVHKHHSLDRRGLSRLERYRLSVTELQLH